MNKTKRNRDTVGLQDIAVQGFYFTIRYASGGDIGTFSTFNKALSTAVKLGVPGFQIVRVNIR